MSQDSKSETPPPIHPLDDAQIRDNFNFELFRQMSTQERLHYESLTKTFKTALWVLGFVFSVVIFFVGKDYGQTKELLSNKMTGAVEAINEMKTDAKESNSNIQAQTFQHLSLIREETKDLFGYTKEQ